MPAAGAPQPRRRRGCGGRAGAKVSRRARPAAQRAGPQAVAKRCVSGLHTARIAARNGPSWAAARPLRHGRGAGEAAFRLPTAASAAFMRCRRGGSAAALLDHHVDNLPRHYDDLGHLLAAHVLRRALVGEHGPLDGGVVGIGGEVHLEARLAVERHGELHG